MIPLGTYPLFAFYVVAGYLMTLTMHRNYGFSLRGRCHYFVRRILKVYPHYWIAALVSLLLISYLGGEITKGFHKRIFVPNTLESTLNNIFIAFVGWYPNEFKPRLVPTSWSITIVLFFYTLIGLGASRNLNRVKVWLAVSLAYVVVSFVLGWGWRTRVFPVGAASLPFSIGAAMFFMPKKNTLNIKFEKLSFVLLFLLAANCLVWSAITVTFRSLSGLLEIGFYLNLLLSACLVYYIVNGTPILKMSRAMDRAIGNYSYPVYLLHLQGGLIASVILYGEGVHEFSFRGLIVCLLGMGITLILSVISIRCSSWVWRFSPKYKV